MCLKKQPIFLIGYMGSGKSTIGPILAEKMGCSFVDLDEEIVKKEGRTIPDIFDQNGEEYFRKIETDTLKELIRNAEGVIALGGGTPIKEENCRLLEDCLFPVVYLKASAETVIGRIGEDESRPMLADCNTNEEKLRKIKRMQKDREPIYQRASKLTLVVDTITPEQAAQKIFEFGRNQE